MGKKSNRSLWTQKLSSKSSNPNSEHLPKTPEPIKLRKPYEGIILGIDPSLRGTGLALLKFTPGQTPQLLHSETIHIKPSLSHAHCLAQIHQTINKIIHFQPIKHAALEETIYVQNFQTAQILGAARGAAIAAVAIHNIPIFQYPPLRIKQSVVGFGRASKEQIAKTITHHLNHPQLLPPDESDAASTALCHAFTWVED